MKVFQHLTSIRISDPTLDLSKTVPDEENETDVLLCDVTDRHYRFRSLVDDSFKEVQSKAALLKHWLDCTAGIIVISPYRPFAQFTRNPEICGTPSLYEFEEFFDCLHDPLRKTENSAATLIGDFLRRLKTLECKDCRFGSLLRFCDGKAQFYITWLQLHCDDQARVFTETITVSTPSRFENSCSKQSCLEFLRSLNCYKIVNAQTLKDLGVGLRNCKHLKKLKFADCGDGMSDLLDQIRNPSTCSLKIGRAGDSLYVSPYGIGGSFCKLTSVEAEKLAGVLPRFNNVTILKLVVVDCCAAAVNKLVSSITHKTLRKLSLCDISLTPVAAAALGRSLPELSSLEEFSLTGVDGSILQVEEMKALFGGMNKTFPALKALSLENFNAGGSLAPLTKRVHFFPNLSLLSLSRFNMDEGDLHGLLESLRYIRNLIGLALNGNPLGSQDRVNSIVKQTLPQVYLCY